MASSTRFKTTDGWLTPYALMCGYEERFERDGVVVRLWQYCGTQHYNVSAYDHNEGKRLLWETFYTLSEARKAYKREVSKAPPRALADALNL